MATVTRAARNLVTEVSMDTRHQTHVQVKGVPGCTVVKSAITGPSGAPGPAGRDGDKSYVQEFAVASNTWVINHNLNKYPAITIMDSAGTVCEGDTQHLTLNQAIVTFTYPFSGRAVCN